MLDAREPHSGICRRILVVISLVYVVLECENYILLWPLEARRTGAAPTSLTLALLWNTYYFKSLLLGIHQF